MGLINVYSKWVHAEIVSSSFFILFGVILIFLSLGFIKFGGTKFAQEFILPTLIIGILAISIGIGLFTTNVYRLKTFEDKYKTNPQQFLQSEKLRVQKTIKEFENVVFKIIPILIIISSIIIILSNKPIVKASAISGIILMSIILLIDSNSYARIKNYGEQLEYIEKSISGEEP